MLNKVLQNTPKTTVQVQGQINKVNFGRRYQKVLNSLSKNVINTEYAVRGQIPIRGEEIMQQIKRGETVTYEFENTTALNIGNP